MAKRNYSSVSSLLSSAQAAYTKIQSFNDSEAAYEYDLSAKTADDFAKYQTYLNGRISGSQNDPTKALSLTKTLTSANRTFNSALIGRLSTQINEGNGDNYTKYNALVDLESQAVQTGDMNLAQSLGNRLASLYDTIKTAEDADRAKGSAAAQTALKKAYNEDQPGVKDAQGNYTEGFVQKLGLNGTDAALKALDAELKTGDISLGAYQQLKGDIYTQKASLLQSASQQAGFDEDNQQAFLEKFNALQGDNGYNEYTSPQFQAAIKAGIQPNEIKVDTFGNRTLAKRDELAPGQYRSNYANGSGVHITRNDENGNVTPFDVTGFQQDPTNGSLDKSAQSGTAYYIDPVTGKRIFYKTDADGNYQKSMETKDADGNAINPFQQAPIAPEGASATDVLAESGGFYKGIWDKAKNIHSFTDLANTLVGGSQSQVFATSAAQLKHNAEVAAQVEAKKQASLAPLPAQVAGGASIPTIRPYIAPPKNATYLATPIQQSPAQSVAAALPAGRPPTEAETARAIGIGVGGYNLK